MSRHSNVLRALSEQTVVFHTRSLDVIFVRCVYELSRAAFSLPKGDSISCGVGVSFVT